MIAKTPRLVKLDVAAVIAFSLASSSHPGKRTLSFNYPNFSSFSLQFRFGSEHWWFFFCTLKPLIGLGVQSCSSLLPEKRRQRVFPRLPCLIFFHYQYFFSFFFLLSKQQISQLLSVSHHARWHNWRPYITRYPFNYETDTDITSAATHVSYKTWRVAKACYLYNPERIHSINVYEFLVGAALAGSRARNNWYVYVDFFAT